MRRPSAIRVTSIFKSFYRIFPDLVFFSARKICDTATTTATQRSPPAPLLKCLTQVIHCKGRRFLPGSIALSFTRETPGYVSRIRVDSAFFLNASSYILNAGMPSHPIRTFPETNPLFCPPFWITDPAVVIFRYDD